MRNGVVAGAVGTWMCLLSLPIWIMPVATSTSLAYDNQVPMGGASPQHGVQLSGRVSMMRELQQTAGPSTGRSGSVLAWGDLSIVGPTPPEVMTGKVIKVAAGFIFAVALLDTHEVVTWSVYAGSTTEVPPGIQGAVVDIAVGSCHALALLTNGTVAAWGLADYGQLQVPTALSVDKGTVKAVHIAAGPFHSLAQLSNGSVLAWGLNDFGQCTVPARLINVTSIAANTITSFAVLSNGTLVQWGAATRPPVRQGIDSVAAGMDQVLAVLQNGSVISWPVSAPLYPSVLQQVTTVPDAAGSNAVAVSARDNVSMALLDTGEVVAWGWTEPGSQLISPAPEAARSNVIAISAGYGYAMALVEGTFPAPAPPPPPPPHPAYPPAPPPFQTAQQGVSGSVTVWGDTRNLGPQPLSTIAGVTKIAAGYALAMALNDKGEVTAWSTPNQWGQNNVPPSIQGRVVDIAAGAYHALALLSDNTVVAWGRNDKQQTDVPSELQAGGKAKAVSIAAGFDHSLAVLSNGSVVAWGGNKWGQANVASAAHTSVVAAFAGFNISLAVLSDGSLVCWGGASPQKDVQQVGVISAAAGADQLVALLHNGSVVSWFSHGRIIVPDYPSILNEVLSVPTDATSHVVAVAAGENVSMALLDSGRVVAWGWSPPDVPITKVPSAALSDVIAIAAGGGFAMALTSTGSATLPDNLLNTSAGGAAGGKLGVAAMVGIIIGAVALIAAIATVIILLWRQQRQQSHADKALASGPSTQVLLDPDVWVHLTKTLRPKEAFMRSAAPEYSWVTASSLKGAVHSVEAGVNDTQLDILHEKSQSLPLAVELSKSELQSQVHLLADGLLGRGAAALVFKCLWPGRFGPQSLLAIKVLKDGSDADVSAVQSFAYEARLLASLQHPNIVRMYGYCLEPPTVCLILELLPISLKQRLYDAPAIRPDPTITVTSITNATDLVFNSFNPGSSSQCTSPSKTYSSPQQTTTKSDIGLPATQSMVACTSPTTEQSVVIEVSQHVVSNALAMSLLEIVRTSTDIAAGLAYLHSQEEPAIPEPDEVDLFMQSSPSLIKDKRIVHRDLKPANILINSQGDAKISDFGLARDHDHTTVGAVNMGAGTMPYMAPEQLAAARAGRAGISATNRVDVYSFGMMMWEMLAGEVPWKGKSEDMIFAVVINHRRPPLPGPVVQDGGDLVTVQQPLQRHVPGLYDHPLLPELNHIIQQCWQQRDRKRPAAVEVHAMLSQLLSKLEKQSTLQV